MVFYKDHCECRSQSYSGRVINGHYSTPLDMGDHRWTGNVQESTSVIAFFFFKSETLKHQKTFIKHRHVQHCGTLRTTEMESPLLLCSDVPLWSTSKTFFSCFNPVLNMMKFVILFPQCIISSRTFLVYLGWRHRTCTVPTKERAVQPVSAPKKNLAWH